MYWTDEQIEILCQGYSNGKSTRSIGNRISRTNRAIQQKAAELRLKHPYYNGGKYQALLRSLQDGELHCIVCGRNDYLTINHKHTDGAAMRSRFAGSTMEYSYWLTRPIEERRKRLEVLCFNHNRLDYYNLKEMQITSLRKKTVERIAEAHARPIECFECGYDEDIRVIEIDHKIPDNYRSDRLNYYILRMPLTEIYERYQLLCSNHNKWKR